MISVATMTGDVSIAGGVRGTLTEAAGPAPCPCVVMLHGFGGHRNEVGGLFAKLAPRLSERGGALDPAGGYVEPLLADTADFFARTRRGG